MSKHDNWISGVCGHDFHPDISTNDALVETPSPEDLEDYEHAIYADDISFRRAAELEALKWYYDEQSAEAIISSYDQGYFSDEIIKQAQVGHAKYQDSEAFNAETAKEWEEWVAQIKPEDLAKDDRTTLSQPFTEVHGFDPVANPYHYCSHPSGVETIEIAEWESFCIGNALKYTLRHAKKNGKEDLEKAIWYLRREIDRLYKD